MQTNMIIPTSYILFCMSILYSHAAQVYKYDVPIISIRAGNAWTINGNFNLIHQINLDEYEAFTNNISSLVEKHIPPSENKDVINYHLLQINQKLSQLRAVKTRSTRSINWIGSAWKWLAGNPDAADWDEILRSQNKIITNNNEQYKVNSQLMITTRYIIKKTNELVVKMNHINSGKEANRIGQEAMRC